MQPRSHKQGRVILLRDVVVGRVGLHSVVGLGLIRVAPLIVLSGGEWNAVVKHRRNHVHKGNRRDDAGPEIRTLVDHGTHEKSAGASAHGKKLRSKTFAAKHLAAGNEVAKAVLLVLHSALLVPGATEVFASANVGNRVGHSALQKTEACDAERGVDGNAVGSVSVKQCGHRTLEICGTDPAHGDLGSVRSRRPKPTRYVATWVVAPHYFLHFFNHLLAGDHVKIIGRGRSRQRGVHIAQRARRRRRI